MVNGGGGAGRGGDGGAHEDMDTWTWNMEVEVKVDAVTKQRGKGLRALSTLGSAGRPRGCSVEGEGR